MKMHRLLGLFVCGLIACSAQAGFATGGLYNVPQTGEITIEFKSQSAGATGSLYFLGSERSGTLTRAASTDSRDLGRWIFSNKGTAAGHRVSLGLFEFGDLLHFAYIVTTGAGNAKTGETSRTDIVADRKYFGFKNTSTTDEGVIRVLMGVEDIRNPSKTDWDYNDLQVFVESTPVPSPGVLALSGAALLIAGSRRKQS